MDLTGSILGLRTTTSSFLGQNLHSYNVCSSAYNSYYFKKYSKRYFPTLILNRQNSSLDRPTQNIQFVKFSHESQK